MSRLQPMRGYVLVRPTARTERTTPGGLVIPETANEPTALGTVVDVGAPRLLESGTEIGCPLEPGDEVIYRDSAVVGVTVDGEPLALLDVRAVLGRLTPGERQPEGG